MFALALNCMSVRGHTKQYWQKHQNLSLGFGRRYERNKSGSSTIPSG